MFAKELIGKLAIRTGPASYGNGSIDNSMTDEPIRVLAATDSHIVYTHPKETMISRLIGDSNKKSVLRYCFCDDKWTDYEELMALAEQTEREIAAATTNNEDQDDTQEDNFGPEITD